MIQPTHTSGRGGGGLFAAGLLGLSMAQAALAQEAMYTQAATMPSPLTAVVRPQYHLWSYGSSPTAGTERTIKYEASHSVAVGIVRDWAVFIDVPMAASREKDSGTGAWSSDKSLEGVEAMVKWRFYQHDRGGVDTERIALMGGFNADNARDDDWKGVTVSPKVGVVYTLVRGRHGFNQDFFYQLSTGGDEMENFGGDGPADALWFNSAYVYRIIPDRFSSDTIGAWYVTAEVNGLYETNGDLELRWAPGLMYEGRRFSFEVMAQLPLWQDVDHRAELDYGLGIGVRVSF